MTSPSESQKGAGTKDVFGGIILAFFAIKVGEWILANFGVDGVIEIMIKLIQAGLAMFAVGVVIYAAINLLLFLIGKVVDRLP